jgi:hypothetical protein
MDPLTASVLVESRQRADDLAFSALPEAPRRQPRPAGSVRRALGWGLLRAAHRVEPATAAPARPGTPRAATATTR